MIGRVTPGFTGVLHQLSARFPLRLSFFHLLRLCGLSSFHFGTMTQSFFLICLPLVPNKKKSYLSLPFNNALTIRILLSDCKSALQGNYLTISSKRSYKTPACPNKRPVWHCSPSLILAQGLRGLQQSATTLTDSFYLIGFDIKNDHKQHSQKVHTKRGQSSCLQRYRSCIFFRCFYSPTLMSEIFISCFDTAFSSQLRFLRFISDHSLKNIPSFT